MSGNIEYQGDLFKGRITPAITEALEEAREFAALSVRSKTPVDTGNLKSNWQFNLKGNGIEFKNDTPYAIFVEMGTRSMAPRAMLRRSLPGIQETFEKALARNIGRKLAAKVTTQGKPNPSYEQYTGKGRSLLERLRNGLGRG